MGGAGRVAVGPYRPGHAALPDLRQRGGAGADPPDFAGLRANAVENIPGMGLDGSYLTLS